MYQFCEHIPYTNHKLKFGQLCRYYAFKFDVHKSSSNYTNQKGNLRFTVILFFNNNKSPNIIKNLYK